jgi:hypothetical protein
MLRAMGTPSPWMMGAMIALSIAGFARQYF